MKPILISLLILFTLACAVQKATLNMYVDPTYDKNSINSIAVFPIRNARIAPSESNQINRKISVAINKSNPEIKILGQAEAVNLLNEHDLAEEWAKFLENYVMSGVPDQGLLETIGEALQVDAIIQGEVLNVFQQDGEYMRNAGQTRVTVRFTMLDVKKAKVLWEASSDGIRKTATNIEDAPPLIEAVNLAVDKIIGNLPL